MNITISATAVEDVKVDIIVVSTASASIRPKSSLGRIDRSMNGAIARILKLEGFAGKNGELKFIHSQGALPAAAVIVVGCQYEAKGDLAPNILEILRQSGARVARQVADAKYKSIAFDLSEWNNNGFKEADLVQALVEGIELALYKFQTYFTNKTAEKKPSLTHLQILGVSNRESNRKAIARAQSIAKGTCLARDLVNTPAKDMTPQELAHRALKLRPRIQVKVYNKAEIVKLKMNSYLAVSAGSEEPPALIHMTYRPRKKSKKTIAIVGKGVTFDSGGLSIKPSNSMETMKDDMAGAAAVIGLMHTLAELKPDVTVHGVVAATENMPSGSAIKPGDIVTSMSGKTVEILNTDAEGRLTLIDALHFIIQKKPELVIDMATLTGACLVALGERISGLMGNDDELLEDLINATEYSGEMLWQLPLLEEYREDLKSPIADIKNIGGRWGGTIEAGLFLQEFIEDARWAHIDIAGPSWTNKDLPYARRGGTGCMVSTLTQYILKL